MSYKFERPFRCKIIALMLNSSWLARYGIGLIEPFYFEQDDEIDTVKAIIDYRKAYGKCPADPADLVTIAGAKYADFIYKIYDTAEAGDLELASDEVIQFAKQQAAKAAILESVDDVNKGDLDAVQRRIAEAVKVGDSILSPGIDPIADVDKWLFDYWADKVRTGLYHLDEVLDGGIGVPELAIVLAPMNFGKSMFLINIGYAAASIGSAKNVLHISHEMSVQQVAKRYAARMLFRFPQREENLVEYENDLMTVARRLMPGRVRVVGGAAKMSYSELERHIDRLIAEDFKPGLIIDDYPDLIVPDKHYSEKRYELSANYEWLRSLSDKYQCPVWGASQATRASLSKEIITMADIAEDIGKAAICDVMVALCQTREELQNDQCRLFVAKIRDGSKKRPLIACKFYGESQAIITTGFVSKDEAADA
jgi:replicative DNA helicase